MWQEYFKVIRILPGRIVVSGHGIIDFSDPKLSLEFVRELYENDFPYLKLTEKGEKFLYGVPQQSLPVNRTPVRGKKQSKKHAPVN